MNKYRLIYVSRAVAPIEPKSIQEIAAVSARRNQEFGVTGILLATRGRYLQVLEGDMLAVNQLYASIVADPRHTDVLLISYQRIAEPLFGEWAMRGISTGLMGRILAVSLKKKYGEEDGDLKIPLDENLAYALLLDVYTAMQENR